MAGEHFQVVFRHSSGASHAVDGLRSVWEADVISSALSMKEALDAWEDLGRLELRDGPGALRPALAAEVQSSPAVASLPFVDLVQQLQRCADKARYESDMHGPGHGGAFTLLHAAAACEHKEAALLLLAAAPGMARQRDRLGRTVLHAVAELGWADVVRTLMMAAPEAANNRDDYGANPLVAAYARRQLEAARALLSTTLSSRSVRGILGSMLCESVEQQNERELAALLWIAAAWGTEGGGSASLLDDVLGDVGPYLLRTALDRCDARTTQPLLEVAPWLATRCHNKGWTALHRVAAFRIDYAEDSDSMQAATRLAEVLLAVPGTATAVDRQGRTALFLAAGAAAEAWDAEEYHEDVPNILNTLAAAARATVALPATIGETPVHLAVFSGKPVLQALLDAAPAQVAATVTAATGLQTPLQLAVETRRLEAVAGLLDAVLRASCSDGQDGPATAWRLLLEAAPGPVAATQLVGDRGITLLHAAASLPTAAVLQLLLSKQVGDVMAVDPSGRLPLHTASEHGRLDAVRLLLAAALDAAMVPDIEGGLPLHRAAQYGGAETVRLLLQAAPQAVTAGSQFGLLPLHWAAAGGNPASVQLLLDAAPATSSSTSKYGDTALMLAVLSQRTDAAKLLLRHGSKQDVLREVAAHYQHLCAFVVAICLPLSAAEWDLVPSPCPGLGGNLLQALQHSTELARQLVRRLHAADAERLRVAALALAREQCRLRVQLPGSVVGRILSLVSP